MLYGCSLSLELINRRYNAKCKPRNKRACLSLYGFIASFAAIKDSKRAPTSYHPSWSCGFLVLYRLWWTNYYKNEPICHTFVIKSRYTCHHTFLANSTPPLSFPPPLAVPACVTSSPSPMAAFSLQAYNGCWRPITSLLEDWKMHFHHPSHRWI